MDGIVVLGPLRIVAGGTPAPLPSRRQRLLLAMLASRLGETVAGSVLIDALWGEHLPQRPTAALQSQVFRLRRQLAPTCVRIDTDGDGYRLEADRAAVDVTRFEDLVDAAEGGAVEHAVELLERALSLWRGRAFDDVADHPAILAHAARLEQQRADAAERRAALLLELGRPAEAAREMEALSGEHPFRERPVAIRMRALARQGRQADALAVYSAFRTALGDELGLEPSPELRAVEREILTHDRPARARIGLPGNSLVGRQDELADVADGLGSGRLVTLTGPGGVGKTRLAVHAAASAEGRYPDGVWLCELAGIASADSVVSVVASALRVERGAGFDELERVVDFLRARRALLVLDNCEHVIDGVCELTRRLLAGAPDVDILATSRRRLGVEGEHVLPVAPLPVGDAEDPDSPAVQLFLDRARAVRRGVAFTGGALADVHALCRRLDGLPLAVELAAARIATRTPSEILGELEARGAPLEDPLRAAERHRSIDAVLSWSYDRLDPFEQRVLRHAAVFAAGFDRAAVAAVVDAETGEVGDALTALAEHSMIVARQTGGITRFRLLEPIRQFAEGRLVEAGERERAGAQHATWFASWIGRADESLRGPDEVGVAAAVAEEIPNLRAAVAWAVEHDPTVAVRIAGALYTYAYWYGASETFDWAVAAIDAAGEAPSRLARAYATATLGPCRRGDVLGARTLAERGIAAAREVDSPDARFVWSALSSVEVMSGNYDAALACQQQAFELARAAGDVTQQARERAGTALVLGYRGDHEAAADTLRAARTLATESRNPTMLGFCDYVAGELLVERDPAKALPSLERAQATGRMLGNRYLAAIAGASAVSCAARSGHSEEALAGFAELLDYFERAGSPTQQWTTVRLLIETLVRLARDDEAATLYGALTASPAALPIVGADATRIADAVATMRERLGELRHDELVAAGAALGDAQAIAFALRSIAGR